ncbi:MAG: hypothetical protein SGARI_005988, partial [Bacillariaceae sp.]
MKTSIFSLILSIIVALMLSGVAEAGQLRLKRRRNPIIEVGLGTIRHIAGPFHIFDIIEREPVERNGEDAAKLLDEEQDIYDSFSFSYSMSMSMSYPEPPTTQAPEREVPLIGDRAPRKKRFRRNSGGLRGL